MCFLHRAMSRLKGYKYYRKVRDQCGDFSILWRSISQQQMQIEGVVRHTCLCRHWHHSAYFAMVQCILAALATCNMQVVPATYPCIWHIVLLVQLIFQDDAESYVMTSGPAK